VAGTVPPRTGAAGAGLPPGSPRRFMTAAAC
jgi:hypothetical protein